MQTLLQINVSFTSFHKVDLNNAWETFHLPIRNCMCKSVVRRVDPEERNTVQSTLALRTSRYYGPRYYGHELKSREKKLLETTPAFTESLYYGHQILVLMVSVIKRVDCSNSICLSTCRGSNPKLGVTCRFFFVVFLLCPRVPVFNFPPTTKTNLYKFSGY